MICKKIKYSVQQLENKNLVEKKEKKKKEKVVVAGYDNRNFNCSRNEETSKTTHFDYFYPCQKG